MRGIRKQPEEEHADETWLIPYADLLTLLLALFIVLFASSKIDQKKFDQISNSFNAALTGGKSFMDHSATIPLTVDPGNRTKQEPADEKTPTTQEENIRQETEKLEQLKEKIDSYIKENGLTTQLDTVLNHTQLMLTISDNALFASGSAELKPDAQKLAFAISEMMSQYPGYNVNVSGHTDNRPIHTVEFESNYELSYKRALNFMRILLSSPTLDPKRFTPIGYGEVHPIDTNDTVAGRAANRRVEVSIIRNFLDTPIEAQIDAL